MTEEIIIDNIDVSKCCFYNNGKCDNPNGMACNCINNAVCYFKELKRLEQENKELKKLKCKFKEYCTCDTEKYRSALEEIRKITNQAEQKLHCCCEITEMLVNIEAKINEVLK